MVVKSYANQTDKTNDVNGTIQAVQTSSALNIQIYSKTAFTEWIKLNSSVIRSGSNQEDSFVTT